MNIAAAPTLCGNPILDAVASARAAEKSAQVSCRAGLAKDIRTLKSHSLSLVAFRFGMVFILILISLSFIR